MNSILIPLFMGLGMREILVIAILILLLFGAKRIPEFMKGLGSGIKEFKKSMKEAIILKTKQLNKFYE